MRRVPTKQYWCEDTATQKSQSSEEHPPMIWKTFFGKLKVFLAGREVQPEQPIDGKRVSASVPLEYFSDFIA